VSKSGLFDSTLNSLAQRVGSHSIRRGLYLAVGVLVLAIPAGAFGSDDSSTSPSATVPSQWRHVTSSDNAADFSVEGRQRFPWFVSLGGYFPDFTGDNTSNSVGAEIAFGYRFPTDQFDFRASVRGQEFDITDAFFNQSTIDVSEFSLDALFRVEAFYIGPGISFGSVTGTTNGFTVNGQSQTVWSVTAGYDITPRVFVEARWQTADVDAYKGYSLNVGYRF